MTRESVESSESAERSGPAAAQPLAELVTTRVVEPACRDTVEVLRVPVSSTTGSSPAAARAWIFAQPSLYKGFVLPSLASSRTAVRGSGGRCLAALLALATLAWSGLARAQAPETAAASTPAGQPSRPSGPEKAPSRADTAPAGGKATGGKKAISLEDEFYVEGKLDKPSAFYVLRRSSTDYDWARLDATMTPLVLESVWDPLF